MAAKRHGSHLSGTITRANLVVPQKSYSGGFPAAQVMLPSLVHLIFPLFVLTMSLTSLGCRCSPHGEQGHRK